MIEMTTDTVSKITEVKVPVAPMAPFIKTSVCDLNDIG